MRLRFYPPESPQPRQKPMKVLVLGLPRAGTTSLVSALTTLGLNPYHFTEAVHHTFNNHFQLWLEALKSKYDGRGSSLKREDFDRILWQYDAVTDAPPCFFVEELLEAYPEAKVILSTRTPESWAKSMQSTMIPLSTWQSWSILALFDRTFSAPYWSLFEFIMRLISPDQPASELTSFAFGQYYQEHCAFVREVVPQERLLEFNPADSWGPLCEFLEVPVPDEEFPHNNDTPFFLKIHRAIYWSRWRTVFRGVAVGCIPGVAIGVAWWWRHGRSLSFSVYSMYHE